MVRAHSAARPRTLSRNARLPNPPPQPAPIPEKDGEYDVIRRPKILPMSSSQPFRFLSLPAELRLKIYDYYFEDFPAVIDINLSKRRIRHRLALFRACREVYIESFSRFFTSHPARIFPTHVRTRRPLLTRFTPSQRATLTSLELRLGPGWNQPPPGWVVSHALGLHGCVNVRKLVVFVECDPSDGAFNGFRLADGFYEGFCRDLLTAVLRELQGLVDMVVIFDANPSVKRSGAMMCRLLEVAVASGRHISWGPMRGWANGRGDREDIDSSHVPRPRVTAPL